MKTIYNLSQTDLLATATYANKDHSTDHLFVRFENDTKSMSIQTSESLRNSPFNKAHYFSASYFPLVSQENFFNGSCYADWVIPSASHLFSVDLPSKTVLVDKVAQCMSIEEYTMHLTTHIHREIENIYKLHHNVVLCYSGGIDSIVLLSYIIKAGLIGRTTLLYYKNSAVTHPSASFLDSEKSRAIDELKQYLKGSYNAFISMDITVADIAARFNELSYHRFAAYCSSTVMTKLNNAGVIFGYYGNTTLLHWRALVDEMIKTTPSKLLEFTNAKAIPNQYSTSMYSYTPSPITNQIANRHLKGRNWEHLTTVGTNYAYAPLGSNYIMSLIRRLDCSTIEIADVFNAAFAKKIIAANAPQLLQFIISESVHEGDSIEPIMIPTQLLDTSKLEIRPSALHNKDGLAYLQSALSSPNLELNTLVCAKAIQFLLEQQHAK